MSRSVLPIERPTLSSPDVRVVATRYVNRIGLLSPCDSQGKQAGIAAFIFSFSWRIAGFHPTLTRIGDQVIFRQSGKLDEDCRIFFADRATGICVFRVLGETDRGTFQKLSVSQKRTFGEKSLGMVYLASSFNPAVRCLSHAGGQVIEQRMILAGESSIDIGSFIFDVDGSFVGMVTGFFASYPIVTTVPIIEQAVLQASDCYQQWEQRKKREDYSYLYR